MNNRFKFSKRTLRTIIIALVVVATVLMSKTYYLGVAHRSVFQYAYYALVILGVFLCGIKTRAMTQKFGMLLPFLALFGINIILHIGDMQRTDINQVLGNMLVFAFVAIASCYVSRDQFARYYIRVLVFYCLVSLPCVLLGNLSPETALQFCQPGYNWTVPVGYSLLYTWGWNGQINTRNAGPFWEPGAFQGFIVLAILFLLYNLDRTPQGNKRIKHRRATLLVLLVTLLTTQSSTGYILLIVLLLTQWRRLRSVFSSVNRVVYFFAITAVFVGSLFIVIYSNNIIEKFQGTSVNSAAIRFADVMGGMGMSLRGGLFGLGETSGRNALRLVFGVNSHDSAGLGVMTYTYGLLFALYYIFLMIRGTMRFFQPRKIRECIVLILILFVLHFTETLWNLPVYVFFLFYNSHKLNCLFRKKHAG